MNNIDTETLYITGAGVSAESGIPTFRGEDGYWTIGSKNYTPQEMATRAMYEHNPIEFLSWYHQGDEVRALYTPWDDVDKNNIVDSLLNIFNISKINNQPVINESFKPFILLFDEYYTELYRITEAQQRMHNAKRMIFIGTSFSVNITQMALQVAQNNHIPIEVVDPNPVKVNYDQVTYHPIRASEYIKA